MMLNNVVHINCDVTGVIRAIDMGVRPTPMRMNSFFWKCIGVHCARCCYPIQPIVDCRSLPVPDSLHLGPLPWHDRLRQ